MLNIYRASAGSGKTHHLTGEYIKLLFRKDLLPEDADHETRFNEILAVTFTNKSTAEMKARIVEELSVLSQNPKDSDYYGELQTDGQDTSLNDEQIREKANHFLTDILNNYSDFAVSTIDSFFQKIVRSFARELNLQNNYEVELNADRVFEASVSNVLEKLDRPHHKKLFDWMLKFSEKKIEEGAGWRLEKDLLTLVKSVMMSEEYRARRETIQQITDDKEWLGNYTKKLHGIVGQTIKAVRALGIDGMEILRQEGFLTTDFKGGIRSKMRIFEKWQSGKIVEPDEKLAEWAESEENWYTKTTKKGVTQRRLSIEATCQIKELLLSAIEMQNNKVFLNYNSAKVILDNIYQLGILADIDREVNEVCNEEGTMLLSSATEMLNHLISIDDAPFVYEKTGTRICSYMIDEFQDTSHMQWNNFRPLIENSLAEGRQNLIVGDVKQSIYRWRGSDWQLLHNGLNKFAVGQCRRETLGHNYRSLREIIAFNNDFFSFATARLEEKFKNPAIRDIFSDVEQKVPLFRLDDKPGAVEVSFIDVQKDEKFEVMAMERLPEAVCRLEDTGFEAKDIAILCRTKKLCKMAADALLKYKSENPDDPHVFDIISSEALMLGSRHIITTIISIFRYIQSPDSPLLKAIAACNFFQQNDMDGSKAVGECFSGNKEIERFLEFSNRPLYDMLEGIVSLLPFVGRDIAYVQAFRDCVLEFANGKKADLSAFLDWWEKNKDSRFINTPEGQNAIRILTIHKSKGLGMPAVILPCAEGTLNISNKPGDILWCQPQIEPFSEEGLILPVKCSKALENTIFAADFEEERLRAIIDNLNTIYVAFTRAKEAMIIFAPMPSEKAKGDEQEALLQSFVLSKGIKKNGDSFLFGELARKNGFEKERESLVETIAQNAEEGLTSRKIPHLSLKHNRLVKDIDAIERGNCIHKALSAVLDYENIYTPIERLYALNQLTDEYFSLEEMKKEINRLLSFPEVRQWFKPGLKVLNERTILGENIVGQKIHRPDRVVIDGGNAIVIDYKTGEHQRKHWRQVSDYMNFLVRMGFKEVEGYIWYTNPHEIVKLKSRIE